MRFTPVVIAILLLAAVPAERAATAADDDRWAAFRPLLGEWRGEGSGQPGKGTGQLSHSLELDGQVLVRRNHVDYPATRERGAFAHDDLLVTYAADGKAPSRAIYWDNEGHTIVYAVSVSPDRRTLVYVSEAAPSSPRFRFTYSIETPDRLRVTFEIAPPGKPEAFSMYSDGVVTRVK